MTTKREKKVLNKKWLIIPLITILIINNTGCLKETKDEKQYNIIYVGKNNDVEFYNIQEAIDASSPNATIFIQKGYYVETIIIPKAITLIGTHVDDIIIDGGFQGHVIDIISDNVSLSNITIQNANASFNNTEKNAGISIRSDNCTLQHCILQNNIVGIQLSTHDNRIENCTFQNNSYGIFSVQAKKNIIANNVFKSNTKYGIHLYLESNTNIIKENIFYNNTCGMRIRARNNIISDNKFSGNKNGLYVCCDSSYNTIYHNDFINNTLYHAKGNYHKNKWYLDNHSGGNYWDDYSGLDKDNDDIGDTSYQILSRNINGTIETIEDPYPLITQTFQ